MQAADGTPTARQRRSNVRRANVTACMRCRAKKQRCDQNIPSCVNCAVAGVECVNVDLQGQKTPRSYIHSLEERVAYLEKQLLAHGISDYDAPGATPATATPATAVAEPPELSAAAAALGGPPLAMAMAPMTVMATAGATATTLPTEAGSEYQSLLEGLAYEPPPMALPSRRAAAVLVAAYFEHSDFFLPVLDRAGLVAELARLYDAGEAPSGLQGPSLVGRFRVAVVFAVAARLLHCKNAAFPTSQAEAYYASAARLLAAHPEALLQGAGLEQLENVALVLQYLFFSLHLASAWYLLGFATRMVVELGLHREREGEPLGPELGKGQEEGDEAHQMQGEEGLEGNRTAVHDDGDIGSSSSGVWAWPAVAATSPSTPVAAATIASPDVVQRKRWVFWAVYSFERILCHVLNRPCSIPDEAIATPLPSLAPRALAGCSVTASLRRFAVHFLRHRRLSSEIERTLTQAPAFNGAALDYAAWRAAMQGRLHHWRATVPPWAPRAVPGSGSSPPRSQLTPAEIFDGCFQNSMVRLLLPSARDGGRLAPLLPPPAPGDDARLARAAVCTVEFYRHSFKEGKLRFYWRTLHHLFRAGVALVHCYQVQDAAATAGTSSPPLTTTGVSRAELQSAISVCSSVLWGMVERYQLGRAYRDTFDAIVAPILNGAGSLAGGMASSIAAVESQPPVDIHLVSDAVPMSPDLFMDIYVPPDEFEFNSFI